MVTCKIDAAVPKMNRPRKTSSNSSGFRLLDSDQLDTRSSISRNSIYKIKIDSMFDDSRSNVSHRFDDRRGTQRSGSIIMYSRRCGSTTTTDNSQGALLDEKISEKQIVSDADHDVQDDVRRMSNSVQAQIERMFTDVAKDATSCSFPVRCLGSLPLRDKVTSLQGLQDPLRQLYLSGAGQANQNTGNLDICQNGLRVRLLVDSETQLTPFHNIAVWSAVKFIVSPDEGGAAFLPLITDPENLDKSTLFRPLTAADQRRLSSGLHAPIFAVVMRSSAMPKILECHGFVCQTAEDAIVIAATLYQSLMAHVGTTSVDSNSIRRRKPRNQNGVSCISIASSSALNGNHHNMRTAVVTPVSGKNSLRSSNRNIHRKLPLPPVPSRPPRNKKRTAASSLSGDSDDIVREISETTTEERKKKSHKTKRAPPIPKQHQKKQESHSPDTLNAQKKKQTNREDNENSDLLKASMSYLDKKSRERNNCLTEAAKTLEPLYPDGACGDILTRVAIPRSGSFLNTAGLTRYKSRATRRHAGKNVGGGSPLGFSELFNEFRLHENLHSLDDILNAIINADGMSFNDLKPIYKEFLMKLAVTLTKDELYQRSKNIMRRQKKKKLKRRSSMNQKKHNGFILGAKGLKKIFWFGQFRACTSANKSNKSSKCSSIDAKKCSSAGANKKSTSGHRNRTGTSGSDVSETVRNENTLNGLHRNSSSGYVSCSECSYDSEACTCISADRCYCSLGADHDRVNEKLAVATAKAKAVASRKTGSRRTDSLISCKTEDKCYCSLGETENGESSETTWCDSDSCISASKCYCKRNNKKKANSGGVKGQKDTMRALRQLQKSANKANSQKEQQNFSRSGACEKLALDYELFTVGGISSTSAGCGKSIKAHEALSMKKSVEVAAVFADVQLSQTTDVKNFIRQSTEIIRQNNKDSSRRRSKSSSMSSSSHHQQQNRSFSHKSSSSNDLLSRLETIEKTTLKKSLNKSSAESCYQAMRPVSVSLEDTLGYLP